MTTDATMNEMADSLDEAANTLDETLLTEGNDLAEFTSKTVYSTFYYFSYGVCFAGFLAGKVIPKTGLVGQGLRDGAAAAKDAVERLSVSERTLDGDFDEPIGLDEQQGEETEHQDSAPAPAARSRRNTRSSTATTKSRRTKKAS